MVEAAPEVVIPGHESVIILSKHRRHPEFQKAEATPPGDGQQTNLYDSYKYSTLITTLTVFAPSDGVDANSTQNADKVLYQKVWKINEEEESWWTNENAWPRTHERYHYKGIPIHNLQHIEISYNYPA